MRPTWGMHEQPDAVWLPGGAKAAVVRDTVAYSVGAVSHSEAPKDSKQPGRPSSSCVVINPWARTCSDEGEPDAGVATGRLHQCRDPGSDEPLPLCVLNHALRRRQHPHQSLSAQGDVRVGPRPCPLQVLLQKAASGVGCGATCLRFLTILSSGVTCCTLACTATSQLRTGATSPSMPGLIAPPCPTLTRCECGDGPGPASVRLSSAPQHGPLKLDLLVDRLGQCQLQ